MTPLAIFATAASSIGMNKLRASLTLLGIVIGVAAVISLMAIGRGAQAAVTSSIESLGANLLFVRPGASTGFAGLVGSQGSASTLTFEDAYALVDSGMAPSIEAVAPELSSQGRIVAGRENTLTQVVGVTPEYEAVRNAPIATGQFISPAHLQSRSEVAVLGATTAETLFGLRDPMGQAIRINGRQFTVIGVLKSLGGAALGNQDDRVLVPLTTAYYRLSAQRTAQGEITVQNVNVQVKETADLDSAVQEIATILRLRHRLTEDDDFAITSQVETIETLEATNETFVVFLGAIASISLLVGGIGIMNIMLVSVTERTREIGIRKAQGAKRRDILFQFVMEATLLSLGGGILGVALGIALSNVLDGRTLLGQSFTTVFNADVAVLALAVSAAIGLFFGIYPAIRAARLHPIEALRYE